MIGAWDRATADARASACEAKPYLVPNIEDCLCPTTSRDHGERVGKESTFPSFLSLLACVLQQRIQRIRSSWNYVRGLGSSLKTARKWQGLA